MITEMTAEEQLAYEEARINGIRFALEESNPNAVLLKEKYDSALMGSCERHTFPAVAAYSMDSLIPLLETNGETLSDILVNSEDSPVFVRGTGLPFEELVATLDSVISLTGFENQVIGIGSREGWPDILIYHGGACVESLSQEMDWEDAQEFFDFNVACLWAGDTNPAFLYEPLY